MLAKTKSKLSKIVVQVVKVKYSTGKTWLMKIFLNQTLASCKINIKFTDYPHYLTIHLLTMTLQTIVFFVY